MQIFHGSQKIVENPQFGLGNPKNDYGLGFYCTQSLELSKEWACQQDTDGYANKYELNTDDLSILNLDAENFSIYFPKYKARDTAARKEYLEHLRQLTYSTDSIYLMDIVRKPELLDEIKL